MNSNDSERLLHSSFAYSVSTEPATPLSWVKRTWRTYS